MGLVVEFAAIWELIEVVAMFVFGSNLFTVCLPNKANTGLGQFILDALNVISFNFFKNKNHIEKVIKSHEDYHKVDLSKRRDK